MVTTFERITPQHYVACACHHCYTNVANNNNNQFFSNILIKYPFSVSC